MLLLVFWAGLYGVDSSTLSLWASRLLTQVGFVRASFWDGGSIEGSLESYQVYCVDPVTSMSGAVVLS